MKTLESYLKRNSFAAKQLYEPCQNGLFTVIVIPVFNEPSILTSLKCLQNCSTTNKPVEIISVVNFSEKADEATKAYNRNTFTQIQAFAEKHNTGHSSTNLRFRTIIAANLPKKHAGVGLARKIGMDEAVRRLIMSEQPNGIIAGFDADSECSPNYLQAIEQRFTEAPKLNGVSIRFEHPLVGNQFEDLVYTRVSQYELYLRYYIRAQRIAGHPFAFQTVGSSFAVRAQAYCKQGGMNRRQAGEDFYFLQKIIALGRFTEMNEACVYPSPRPSDRVPFGTGAAITKGLLSDNPNYMVYKFEAFLLLKDFIGKTDSFFTDNETTEVIIEQLNPVVKEWLVANDFDKNLSEIRNNSSDLKHFRKRYFAWFNAFKVLKFLNFAHETLFTEVDVIEACNELLNYQNQPSINTVKELLSNFRKETFETARSLRLFY